MQNWMIYWRFDSLLIFYNFSFFYQSLLEECLLQFVNF